jgi:PAS domain S-box-containing protein
MTEVTARPAPLHLLIGEREEAAAGLYLAELSKAGYSVSADVVTARPDFVGRARAGTYDLLIARCDLPGWPANQAALLKEQGVDAPLILVTEDPDQEAALATGEDGAFDCILRSRLFRLTLAARRVLEERRLAAERLRAEKTLRDTIHTLDGVLEASPLPIIALDPQGRVTMWNRSAESMFGWSQSEVLDQLLPTIPAEKEQEFQALLAAQLEGRAHAGVETFRARKDGTLVDVSLWTAPLCDDAGGIYGKVAVLSDVTDRNRDIAHRDLLRAQEQQARSEAIVAHRFRKLLESAPDAILEVNRDGIIEVVNHQAESLFGYRRDDLVGKSIDALIPDRYRPRHAQNRASYAKHPVTRPMGTGLDLHAIRADGTEFAVDINLSPVRDEEGEHVICVVRDVSERKRAEEQIRLLNQNLTTANAELELRNREVERANRLKSEFLASMSHELRTPLNAIIGFSELLGEQTSAILSDKQKRFLGHIQNGAKHLLELINDILDLSKIEAGRVELHYEDFTMAVAVAEVLASVRPLATAKRLQLDSQVPVELFLNSDRLRFKQILYNLFSNAVKFTPNEGRVWITSKVHQGFVETEVGDTGIGIPAEEQESIFDSFHQVSATTKGVREGTGLGLTITRRLVEELGGQMWLESKLGEGSRFYFTLPLPVTTGQDEAASTPGAVLRDSQPLVLVAEDDGSGQELLVSYLESEGFRTATASTGAEAVRLAHQLQPDLITLDMLLPGKSGFEVMDELKNSASTRSIPIVVVSVLDERKMGFALGATEYLLKPVGKEVLLNVIRRHVPTGTPGDVLVVDDEAGDLQLISDALSESALPCALAQSGRDALRILSESQVSAVVLDLMMPEMNGFELLQAIRDQPLLRKLPVIVLTAKDLTEEDRLRLRGKVSACLEKGRVWKPQLVDQLRLLLETSL